MNESAITYINSTLIQFTFPSNSFIMKDFIKVSLLFGEEIFFLAE